MTNILVTGGRGQLGRSIAREFLPHSSINAIFVDFDELDITNKEQILAFFEENKFSHCINCAAYTAVDLAENEKDKANKVNDQAVKYLAEVCKIHRTKLIHISTDFVFDGLQSSLYDEESEAHPINIYGLTKLEGERAIQKIADDFVIIRTAWLYSEFCNNFVKTMLRLGEEKSQLNVVSDQIGTPTYAGDLAKVVLKIVLHKEFKNGLYHFSNEGVASWYDFAFTIMNYAGLPCKVLPIKTVAYPTPAKRPFFSVMDKSKIKKELNIEINHWTESLKDCIQNLIENKYE
ncbi:MAG: dTDP-4-dehydrorhamnose reductase [Psychroserpens sp.]|jgi:dTDP-4-dehydrorhamnose reductase